MKRLVLLLLAAIPIVILFVLAPWEDAAQGTALTDDPRMVDREDIPAAELGSNADPKADLIADETPGGEGAERRSLSDDHIQVSGQLVDRRGAPIESVGLQLRSGKLSNSPFAMLMNTSKSSDIEVQTDAEGRFTFKVPADKGGSVLLASGELVWTKRPPRFMPSEQDLDLGQLTVTPGAILSGRVLSEDHRPIAGVLLRVTSYEGNHYTARKAESNAQGKFTLKGLPGGQSHVSLSCKGYMSRNVRVVSELGKTTEDLVIRLRHGSQLRGLVLDDRARPIEGVMVQVSGQGRRTENGGYEYGNGNSKTDAKGQFSVDGLGDGPYTLNASLKGYATARLQDLADTNSPVQVEMTRLGKVLGRLVDETGAPIVGSRVRWTLKPPKETPSRSARNLELSVFEADLAHYGADRYASSSGRKTDENGEFTVGNIKPGRFWLVAKGSHRQAVHGPVTIQAGQELSGVEIKAVRGARVLVTVLDPDGVPIDKVRVSISKAGKAKTNRPGLTHGLIDGSFYSVGSITPSEAQATGRTDKTGKCELGGLKPGEYKITVTHKSWVTTGSTAVKIPEKGIVEADLTMAAGGTVALQVVDHRGKPAAEQKYRIMLKTAAEAAKYKQPGAGTGRQPVVIRGVFSSPGSTGKSGRTDATGRATIGPLAPGDYVGFLEFGPGQDMGMMFYGGMGPSQPMGSQIGEQVSFRVVALQTVEVALTRPQMASLTGMIRDETGAIRNALVMLAPDRGKKPGHDISTFINTQRARTNSDGVYRFEGLKPGKYTLTIQAQKDGMAFLSKVEIQGSGEQQNDVFLQAGTLEVRLQTEGKAAAGIMLMLTPAQNGIQIRFFLSGSRSKTATSDADGLVEYRRVPPGKYTLRFKDGDYLQPKSDPIEVAAGGTTQHEMAAEWAAILRYVCKPAPGRKPLQAIQVETTREGDKPKMSWNRATSGKVKALKPGRYSVRARRANQQDKWTQPRTIELKPGASELLEIILP